MKSNNCILCVPSTVSFYCMENCVLDTDACETWPLLSKNQVCRTSSQHEVPLYMSKNKNTHNCEVVCIKEMIYDVYSQKQVVKK